MKKNHFHLKNYVVATSVFILSVVAGILIFFGCVQNSVRTNSQQTLETNVERQSEHLHTILDIHYQYLDEIASVMENRKSLFLKKIKNGWYPFMRRQAWKELH